jgi:hypothetical protein
MRLTISVVLLCFPAALSAQSTPCTPSASDVLHHDSYKPSDLAIIRNYGGTVLAQVPLGALLKLDPYVPTEAALLRHVGGAIPLWAFGTYPWYVPAPVSGPCEPVPEARVSASAPPTLATFNDVLQAVARPSSVTSGTPRATTERNRGISIQFNGRAWSSDGPAVPFSETAFEQVGVRNGAPIFRRAGGDDSVIYVRTTPGMVAPFRAVR